MVRPKLSFKDNTMYVRLPPMLKAAVVNAAKQEGISANQYVMRALEKGVSDAKKNSK